MTTALRAAWDLARRSRWWRPSRKAPRWTRRSTAAVVDEWNQAMARVDLAYPTAKQALRLRRR